MAPQQKNQTQPVRAQYGEIIRWQVERLLASNLLAQIAGEQGFQAASKEHDSNEAEDRRLARVQRMLGMNQEQHRKEHFKLKQERERLIREIRALHQLVSKPL